MNEPELWLPEAVDTLPPLLVVPNGTADTCRVREIDKYQWQEKPRAILGYYRQATEAEAAQLLPEAA